MLRSLRSPSLVLAAAALLAPAAANAATTPAPSISGVTPLKLSVGDTLTVTGANFRPGKALTTVVFQRDGKPAVFVKAKLSTRKKLTVVIPAKLGAFLAIKSGAAVPTKFKLRVLTTKFSRAWTSDKNSPTISAKAPDADGGAAGTTPGSTPAGTTPAVALTPMQLCEKNAALDWGKDADGDGLDNGTELNGLVLTDPCNPDTDGDGATDGYEYYSAKDLNGSALPYPDKRPWPNPLDPTDIAKDFDGDGLLLGQEFQLWRAAGGGFPITSYSDGLQATGGLIPAVTNAQKDLDLDQDGYLTDDEKDFDGDLLSNMVEFNYTGTQAWWNGVKWKKPHDASGLATYTEKPYTIRLFSDLDPLNADSDHDGIIDGLDDQDADGWNNKSEMQFGRWRLPADAPASNHLTPYRVHPFNPCLPDPNSPTCSRYIPLGGDPWPPFDNTQIPGDAIPFGYNGAVSDPAVAWDMSTMDPTADPSLTFTGPWSGSHGLQGP